MDILKTMGAAVLLVAAGCASGGGGGLTTTAEVPVTTHMTTKGGNYELGVVEGSRIAVHVIPAPLEAVWKVLPAVYAELGVEAGVVNAAAHQYGNRGVVAGRRLAGERISDYLDCGMNAVGGKVADSWRVEFNLISGLTPNGSDATELRTALGAIASPRTVSSPPSRCSSTGELEERIAELIEARLAP